MEKPLTPEEVQAFAQRLREQHGSLQGRLRELEQEALLPGEEGQLAQRSDASVEEAARDPAAEVLGSEEAILYEVRDAIERIAEGTFGRCETCEQPIERERLELLPHARMCAGCAREAETWGSS